MWLSFFVIVFVILMAYLWALQGLFSSLLHLILVIASGALALALWEPLAYWIFTFEKSFIALNAWGVSLLVGFVVPLLVFRVSMDKLVPNNMHFPDLADKIGGGVLGLLSGILTGGLLVIALNFMPFRTGAFGYQPWVRSAGTGKLVNANVRLWIPVDRWTASWFAILSGGSFSSGHPMKQYVPELAKLASSTVAVDDPNGARVTTPDSVTVSAVYMGYTPVEGMDESVAAALPKAGGADQKVLVTDLEFHRNRVNAFPDSILRLNPSQVQLLAEESGQFAVHEPDMFIAISEGMGEGNQTQRVLKSLTGNRAMYVGAENVEKVAAVFVIPAAMEARYVRVRNVRLELTNLNTEKGELAAALGKAQAPKAAATTPSDGGPTPLGPRAGGKVGSVGLEARVTNELPVALSKNITGVKFRGKEIFSGSRELKGQPNVSRKNRVNTIYEPNLKATVRVLMSADRANSTLGRAMTQARALQEVYLEDNGGGKWNPFGYVLSKSNGDQVIHFDPNTLIYHGKAMPIDRIQTGDQLYVYFQVPRKVNRTIVAFKVGQTTVQQMAPLPVEPK